MTQSGNRHAEAALHGTGGVAEARQEVDRRPPVDETASGQQQQQEHVRWQEDHDRRMLESLVNSLLRVLEGPSCSMSSEAASASAERPSHRAGGVVEDMQERVAAEVDTKRPRVGDAARGQQEQQQQRGRVTSSTPTNMVAIRAGQQPFPSVTTATTATSIVLSSPDLLLHVMGYMCCGEGDLHERVQEVGRLAVVCRAWRNAAQHKSLWEPLAKALIPRLADVQNATTTQAELQKAGGSYRGYLVQYGRLLSERYVVMLGWNYRLVLQFEIWDDWPVHYLFSGKGTVVPALLYHGEVTLGIDTEGGPAFSAATRSGPYRQYESIREYLEALRDLHVRVTVHDAVTGRRAVLRDCAVTGIREVREDDEHDYRADDDDRAEDDHDYLVTCDGQSLTTVSYGPTMLDAAVCFRVVSMSGNSALPDDQKRYRVVPLLSFEAADDLYVGRLVYSTLGY